MGVTVLGSGSDGNAIVVQTPSEAILIDAGFSARELQRRLDEAGVDESLLTAILVTHEHVDHVRGLRVYAKRRNLPVYSNHLTAEGLRDRAHVNGAVRLFTTGSAFEIGEFRVDPFSIPHDAIDPVGFVIRWRDRRIGIATDLGHVSHLVCHHLRECDLLIVESNHDLTLLQNSSRPWALKQRIMGRHGHLSNDASMDLVRRVLHARTQHLILAHASQECNCYDLVHRHATKCLKELHRHDITPLVARQESVLPPVWL
ncbi:MAG: hypothetical protein A3K19_11160 [Lentisphaerae bacterium RIFOXYB12_FULL_65_16]|nr:MAG: hypothetical protein A3K18_06720 [Lentisphaerae bacterium RIFOXYA12_64_32]OGV91660.1 MAG: hypothetical protein A3K19_11160 [Lentisphaerae bacterium RIFOXYB12_FULL_65_16]